MSKLADALTEQKKKRSRKPRQGPSVAKAREMLRDGTANGQDLTDKQRRYFGYIAGHSKW
jgi:hypothetical protein